MIPTTQYVTSRCSGRIDEGITKKNSDQHATQSAAWSSRIAKWVNVGKLAEVRIAPASSWGRQEVLQPNPSSGWRGSCPAFTSSKNFREARALQNWQSLTKQMPSSAPSQLQAGTPGLTATYSFHGSIAQMCL
jgi:hypothetical protein